MDHHGLIRRASMRRAGSSYLLLNAVGAGTIMQQRLSDAPLYIKQVPAFPVILVNAFANRMTRHCHYWPSYGLTACLPPPLFYFRYLPPPPLELNRYQPEHTFTAHFRTARILRSTMPMTCRYRWTDKRRTHLFNASLDGRGGPH